MKALWCLLLYGFAAERIRKAAQLKIRYWMCSLEKSSTDNSEVDDIGQG
jgi:hypothetical protein